MYKEPLTHSLLCSEFVELTLYYVSGQYGGWGENYLIPCVYQTPEAFNTGASTYVGKSMTVMMPIMIENVQNDYTFKFNIDKLSNTATK